MAAGRGTGQGAGRGTGRRGGMGPGGECVCPHCGHKMPHTPGTPCMQMNCPKCGTRMVRA